MPRKRKKKTVGKRFRFDADYAQHTNFSHPDWEDLIADAHKYVDAVRADRGLPPWDWKKLSTKPPRTHWRRKLMLEAAKLAKAAAGNNP